MATIGRTDPFNGKYSNSGSETAWHTTSPAEALSRLGTSLNGLAAGEVHERQQRHGPNIISRTSGLNVWRLLWTQINNPLIWVLIAAGLLAVAMGNHTDGAIVLTVVALNTIIAFVQEYRAGRAIEALSAMVPEYTMVIREGQRQSVHAAELVPGDIVALASGDKAPADMRLIEVRNLQINESALTGESLPVEKEVNSLPADSALADRKNMAYSGTLVTYGTARAVVVETGMHTELGRISAMLKQTVSVDTPLTQSLARLAKIISISTVLLAVALVALGLFRGYSWSDATLAAISLAVAAIPEGLPAIFTIALAIGVQRMAARHAIIRHLPAVETLGSTTVICSDKTGTLTRNEMTVQEIYTFSGIYHLTGVGYGFQGQLTRDNQPLNQTPDDVRELLLAGVLCNDANLLEENGQTKLSGDPTEGALVSSAAKGGVPAGAARDIHPRLNAIPFESELQFMATLHRAGAAANAQAVLYVKGAPEVVFTRCLPHSSFDHDALHREVEKMAARGMRVLAFAKREFNQTPEEIQPQVEATGLTFLGLQGMIDPPRPEVIEAIKTCHAAGITVKMITGDHAATARAIGAELGLGAGEAMTGAQLSHCNDQELRDAARRCDIFARVAPEHKLRLVQALQADGNVVAMTGDGVNDAPALKQANIGIAMGITGTAVSKEAADIVLTNDNFASITAAVKEGRRIYDNLIKALAFILPTNIGQALLVLFAVAFFPIVNGSPLLPVLPVQVLYINLVAIVLLGLPLAFEAMEPDVMKRTPRRINEPVLQGFVVLRLFVVSLLMSVSALGLFIHEFYYASDIRHVASGQALAEAQTLAVTTVVLFQIFYLFNCRSLLDSFWNIGLWSNKAIYAGIGLQILVHLAFVYSPPMNALFHTAPLPPEAWIKATMLALLVMPVISFEKWVRQRRRNTLPQNKPSLAN